MRINLVDYSAAYGRLGGMKARALRPDLVSALVEARDVASAVAVLRERCPDLEGLPAQSAQVRPVEHALRSLYFRNGSQLIKLMKGPCARLLRTFLAEADVWNVKLFLRKMLATADSPPEVDYYRWPGAFVRSERFDEVGEVRGVAELFRGTPLEPVVDAAVDAYDQTKQVFDFELHLDAGHLRLVWDTCSHLGAGDRKRLATDLLAPYIASTSLVWALQLKFLNGLSPEEIFPHLTLPDTALRPQAFWQFIPGKSIGECIELVPRSCLGGALGGVESKLETLSELSGYLRRWLWRRVRRRVVGYPFTALSFFGHLLAQKYLIDDIVRVLHAKGLSIDRGELSKSVVCVEI